MKLVWSRPAQRDLEAILGFIAQDSPRDALRLCSAIEERVGALASAPGIGRPGRVSGTRELVLAGTPYLVPYRVKDDRIEILAVFHGARKWPDRFDEEPQG